MESKLTKSKSPGIRQGFSQNSVNAGPKSCVFFPEIESLPFCEPRMLDALEAGAPAGPLLDTFRQTFPTERTLEDVVGSPAYGEWRETVTKLLIGY